MHFNLTLPLAVADLPRWIPLPNALGQLHVALLALVVLRLGAEPQTCPRQRPTHDGKPAQRCIRLRTDRMEDTYRAS